MAKRRKRLLVVQDLSDGGLLAKGPSVRELVQQAVDGSTTGETEVKAMTLRTTAEEVAVLDQLAKLFGESRNVAARRLLVASMREALAALPEDVREQVQVDACHSLGITVSTERHPRQARRSARRGALQAALEPVKRSEEDVEGESRAGEEP